MKEENKKKLFVPAAIVVAIAFWPATLVCLIVYPKAFNQILSNMVRILDSKKPIEY